MGASHATFFAADEEVHLPKYTMEQRLYPGSGRMMRTFRMKDHTGALVVAKHMYVSKEDEDIVQEQIKELRRIREALKDQPHVAPFLFWNIGDYQTRSAGTLPIRPVELLRPHFYTTLSDRLASRPFLAHVEKLWILYQLLNALQAMHDAGVVHGFLTSENVGLSSWNYVVLLDVASYKPRTRLPDDDPSEYLYYFQELNKHGTDTTPREKRCYLAPERFFSRDAAGETEEGPLTPAMDIFSAGCVAIETFLNGERALDLGDLMEYRRRGLIVPSMQQKLNKIESSSLRAACRHMLHLDPGQRLSAKNYLERLETVIPPTFETLLNPFFERVTCEALHPDARMQVAASWYGKALKDTAGVTDCDSERYFARMLGPTMCELEIASAGDRSVSPKEVISDVAVDSIAEKDRMLSETDILLQKLDSLKFDDDEDPIPSVTPEHPTEIQASLPTSIASTQSLLVYLQLVLSTLRNVQRPSSKIVGLQLLERSGKFSSDETKLQRIVPVAISLLNDQDPLVKAAAVQVITSTLSTISVFPPSDSKIFTQYIFKRMAHLISDQSLVVRVAFARCIPLLAETAHRFLDISHAVRLYEAVGAGGGGSEAGSSHGSDGQSAPDVFTEDVAKLLGGSPSEAESKSEALDTAESDRPSQADSTSASVQQVGSSYGNVLIDSSYKVELAALHEVVSRWVVQITTDQSDHSSPTKRTLLVGLTRLCNFFGRDGVMAFILPQILAFLNDRRDWQLRAALFHHLPSVCYIIGRAATEHFVLPCLEIALVDSEDEVISSSLQCLTSLVEMGLLSRSVLVTPPKMTSLQGHQNWDLLERYLPLLLYPASNVRRSAIGLLIESFKTFDFPDAEVFLLPVLRPYLRFEPSTQLLITPEGLEKSLFPALSKKELNRRLASLSRSNSTFDTEQWTSIGAEAPDVKVKRSSYESQAPGDAKKRSSETIFDVALDERMTRYLVLLARSQSSAAVASAGPAINHLGTAIEGSLKMAQSMKFPNQNVAGSPDLCIPSWYAHLAETTSTRNHISESFAIRSASSLGQVYGLSILHPTGSSGIEEDLVLVKQKPHQSADVENMLEAEAENLLQSPESKIIRAACEGEWGADTVIDPTVNDTALLISKLKGLEVPVLPPNLGNSRRRNLSRGSTESPLTEGGWKPRVDGLVASSSPVDGHTASVARLALADDQSFFVSGSFDGTCRAWELRQLEDSRGVMESSAVYTGHCADTVGQTSSIRVNDVTIVESSHSAASGASDGSVHVWRIDMVLTKRKTSLNEREAGPRSSEPVKLRNQETRVSGSTVIRKIDASEGEVLAVSHFNLSSASILAFATQSCVHSWDLRCPREPFKLEHQPDTGYQTSMIVGADRNWMVTGTSRGFIALWDIRFQQVVKLWQQNESSAVRRLETFSSLSCRKGENISMSGEDRPHLFAACSPNECALVDLISGSCRQCFRVSTPSRQDSSLSNTSSPYLRDVPITSGKARFFSRFVDFPGSGRSEVTGPYFNAMVGSYGGDRSYLITGGDDCYIRYWDFNAPSKCFTISGGTEVPQRDSYERMDNSGRRYMICQQAMGLRRSDIETSKLPRALQKGATRPAPRHSDSIQDLKLIDRPMQGLLSCSRDGMVQVWR